MSVITPVVTQQQTLFGHTWSVVWPLVTNADTCGPIQMSTAADRSVHAFGTFNGASVAIHGSNEATNDSSAVTSFVALHDPQGIAIAITTANIEEISEVTNWIKPVITGGGGSQSVTVAMTVRSPS